jgi:hypothetical protein
VTTTSIEVANDLDNPPSSINLDDILNPRNFCGECENFARKVFDCTECSARTMCGRHIIQHASQHHPGSPMHAKLRIVAVQRSMAKGMTAFKMPGAAITAGKQIRDPSQSVWFRHAELLGLQHPCIFNWRPSPQGDLEAEATREREIRDFLDSMDLQVYDYIPTKNHTFLAAEPSNIRFHYTEEENDSEDAPQRDVITVFTPEAEPTPDVTSAAPSPGSGWINDPNATAGKRIKRHKVKTTAEAAIAHDEPSPAGEIRTTLRVVRYRVQDTDAAGDGTGKVRESVAHALLLEGGAALWGDIIRFQVVAIGLDNGVKGMFNIIPDELWNEDEVDLIIDSECTFADVLNNEFTLMKMRAIRHRRNSRCFIMDGVMHAQIVVSLLSVDELVEQAYPIADRLERDSLERAITGDIDDQIFHPLQFLDWNRTSEDDNVAPLLQSETKDYVEAAYNMSGYSPFANGNVMEYASGQLFKHIQGVLRKKREVPSILVSGEALWYQHYEYCITGKGEPVKSPKPGYARFIWHLTKPDQLHGIAMHRSDIKKSYPGLDTPDKDDLMFCIFFYNKQMQPCVLIMRMPSSIGGGYILRVNQTDAKRLQQLGYHFYTQTGEPRYPGIHDFDELGNPLFPDVLHPQPFDNPPQWPVPHDQAISSMMRLTQFRKVIGEACNMTANLDFAGIYDPIRHKFNLSDAVIDPAYMCSADPSSVLIPMRLDMLAHILAGGNVDPCVYPRIADIMQELHYDQQREQGVRGPDLKALTIKYACTDACTRFKDTMVQIRQILDQRLRRRQVLSNGPVQALIHDGTPPEIVRLATQSVADRDQLWTSHGTHKRRIEDDDELSFDAKRVKLAQLWETTRDEERRITSDAYEAAAEQPGYQAGLFTTIWVQAKLSTDRRYRRVGPHGLDKVTTSALAALPPTEYLAYFASSVTEPTVMARSASFSAVQQLQPGRVYRFSGDPASDRTFELKDDQGVFITKVEREANIFTDVDLTYQGVMPKWPALPGDDDAKLWEALLGLIHPDAPEHRRELLTHGQQYTVRMQRNKQRQPVYFLADADRKPVIKLTEAAKKHVNKTCTALPPGNYGPGWSQPFQLILVFTAAPSIAWDAPQVLDGIDPS